MSDVDESYPSFSDIEAEVAAEEAGTAPVRSVEADEPAAAVEKPAAEAAPPVVVVPPEVKAPEPNLPLSRHKAILEETRTRAAAAERESAELRARLDAIDAAKPPKPSKLEGVRENLPENVFELLAEQQATLEAQAATIKTYGERVQAEEQAAAARGRAEAQAALEGNADLSAWLAEDGDAWATAKDYDAQLRTNPRWAGKPMSERFAAVARLVKADLNIAPAAPAPPAPVPNKALPKAPPAPGSLSDLPGGATPSPAGSTDLLSSGDPLALAAMGSRMTNAEFERFMARAG